MKPLIVVGSSGHASTVLEAIELRREYQVTGLLDPYEPVGKVKHGYRIYGSPDDAHEMSRLQACRSFFVAIGDNWTRWRITAKLISAMTDIDLPTIVHPSVILSSSARLGRGTFVMAAAVICANAELGEGCIVNTASTVNHDCRMGAYSSLSAGVHMGGASALGERSSLGLASCLREKRKIGNDTVVGAGAVVLQDIPDGVVAFGVPARAVRPRSPEERYML